MRDLCLSKRLNILRQKGPLLTNLFKAFDCRSHGLLIAKLKVWAFSIDSLRLVKDYLSNRKS